MTTRKVRDSPAIVNLFLELVRPLAFHDREIVRANLFGQLAAIKLVWRFAERCVRRDAEGFAELPIHEHETALEILDENQRSRVVDHGSEFRLALAQLLISIREQFAGEFQFPLDLADLVSGALRRRELGGKSQSASVHPERFHPPRDRSAEEKRGEQTADKTEQRA